MMVTQHQPPRTHCRHEHNKVELVLTRVLLLYTQFGRVRLRDKDRLARSLGQLPPAGAVGASGAGAGASSNDVDGNSAGTHRTGLTSSYTSTGGSPKHGGGGKRTGRSRGTHRSGSSAMSGSKRTRYVASHTSAAAALTSSQVNSSALRLLLLLLLLLLLPSGRGKRHKRGQSRDKGAGGSSTPRNDDAARQFLGAEASPLLEMTATTHAVAGDLSVIGKTDRMFSRGKDGYSVQCVQLGSWQCVLFAGTHCYMYSSAIGMTGKAYIRDPELQPWCVSPSAVCHLQSVPKLCCRGELSLPIPPLSTTPP